MVEAGLLEPRGETRGRFYVGSDEVRALYRDVRSTVGREIRDPYEGNVQRLSEGGQRRMLVTRP